jgi:hypothetical protein
MYDDTTLVSINKGIEMEELLRMNFVSKMEGLSQLKRKAELGHFPLPCSNPVFHIVSKIKVVKKI